MEKKTRNVFQRAIHKMRKKRKLASESTAVEPVPPKIEELDIEPQLLEKYLARKEQSRRRDQPGEQRLVNKSTAMLIFIGLLSGVHQWVQERTRKLIPIWATLLATFLTTWGVGSVCLFLLNRSM